jgi:hypothetical protein
MEGEVTKIFNLSDGGDLLALKLSEWAKKHLPKDGHYEVAVEHDDWCAFLNGKGECDCDPNFSIL